MRARVKRDAFFAAVCVLYDRARYRDGLIDYPTPYGLRL